MAYDGAQFSARVDGTTNRDLYRKVVDQVLNGATLASRWISAAEPFNGKVMDFTLDVTASGQGQWITGLETLNSSAESTAITTSYARTFFTIPVVSIMTESFANEGSLGLIPLDAYKYEKAAAQAFQYIGAAFYSFGQGGQSDGLEGIVDNGTNLGTIGGQSRTTYSVLDATVNAASSNKLTLAQMATLHDTISAAGLKMESPNVGMTTKTVWSLYEQLLAPNVRASYDEIGADRLLMRSKHAQRNSADIRDAAGFTSLSYRDLDIAKDDAATSGVLYFLNEDYVGYYGHKSVPAEWKESIENVSFGDMKAYEGTGAMALQLPSEYHGWFYQKPLTIPEQAGRLSRFYVIGNAIAKSFRRQGKIPGITGV